MYGSLSNSFRRHQLLASPHRSISYPLRTSRSSSAVSTPYDSRRTDPPNYDSFDYSDYNSFIYEEHRRQRATPSVQRKEQIARWTLTFLIAVVTTLFALFIVYCTQRLLEFKLYMVEVILHRFSLLSSFLFYTLVNLGLVFLASFLIIQYSPISAGSGICEVRCILNGLKIPYTLRLSTLICKLIGIICAVGSSLPIGKEGPMISIGAVIGAGISQGTSTTLTCFRSFRSKVWNNFFQPFRNDREKRDFITCGSAAGVSVAFGAPLGGVLFALEEGSSFWNQLLTWRSFFCAMTSAFLLNFGISFFKPGVEMGRLSQPGMLAFGDFLRQNQQSNNIVINIYEVPFFIFLGGCGGICGAFYNYCNIQLCRARSKFFHTRKEWKYIEIFLISSTVSCFSFGISYVLTSTCYVRSSLDSSSQYVRFICPKGEISPIASLFLSPSETTIKLLFHSTLSFTYRDLLIFGVLYYFLAAITYGASIPSGLFVPHLVVGATFGRIIGQFLQRNVLSSIDVGSYALIGAAAFLGGMTRMTISLTVILLEATSDMSYGLPLMVTLMAAKWTGDLLNEGLYDLYIHERALQFLEWQPTSVCAFLLTVDVMNHNIKCLSEIVQVSTIYHLLKTSQHKAYPVVDQDRTRKFRGVIKRNHLLCILEKREFHVVRPIPYQTRPKLQWSDFEASYPYQPNLSRLHITSDDMNLWIDLTPYMNPSPYVIQEHSPVSHAFLLFRTLGLRHLPVVNMTNQCVGIITRKDLTTRVFHKQLDDLGGREGYDQADTDEEDIY